MVLNKQHQEIFRIPSQPSGNVSLFKRWLPPSPLPYITSQIFNIPSNQDSTPIIIVKTNPYYVVFRSEYPRKLFLCDRNRIRTDDSSLLNVPSVLNHQTFLSISLTVDIILMIFVIPKRFERLTHALALIVGIEPT